MMFCEKRRHKEEKGQTPSIGVMVLAAAGLFPRNLSATRSANISEGKTLSIGFQGFARSLSMIG